jgi:hypothetical protein
LARFVIPSPNASETHASSAGIDCRRTGPRLPPTAPLCILMGTTPAGGPLG